MTLVSSRSGFHIRPRFSVETDYSVDELYQKCNEVLSLSDRSYNGQTRKGFVSLFPKPEEHRPWSPHLSVTIEATETGTLLRGHYGPSPGIWTLYIFIYAIIALLIVIISVIGLSNWSLGESAIILWAVPFLAIAFGSFYYVSYIGQKKSHDQLMDLHHYFEDLIGKHIENSDVHD